jgi:hypothetical protein
LDSGQVVLSFCIEDAIAAVAIASDALTVVAGDMGGHVHFLRLEHLVPGPSVTVAWRVPRRSSVAFGCTHCRTWSEVPTSALGTELPCPHCGQPVKLNPFVIETDWRPVAAAWQGEVLDHGGAK